MSRVANPKWDPIAQPWVVWRTIRTNNPALHFWDTRVTTYAVEHEARAAYLAAWKPEERAAELLRWNPEARELRTVDRRRRVIKRRVA